MVPVAGSAYTFSYVGLGEVVLLTRPPGENNGLSTDENGSDTILIARGEAVAETQPPPKRPPRMPPRSAPMLSTTPPTPLRIPPRSPPMIPPFGLPVDPTSNLRQLYTAAHSTSACTQIHSSTARVESKEFEYQTSLFSEWPPRPRPYKDQERREGSEKGITGKRCLTYSRLPCLSRLLRLDSKRPRKPVSTKLYGYEWRLTVPEPMSTKTLWQQAKTDRTGLNVNKDRANGARKLRARNVHAVAAYPLKQKE